MYLRHVGVVENDPLKEKKKEFFGTDKPWQLMVTEMYETVQVQEAMSVLRVIFFDEEENIDELMKHKDQFASEKHVPVISNRNELKTLHELIKLCYIKLQHYPRTFSGDLELLGGKDLTVNHRNALNITISEKIQLVSLIEAAKGIMDSLFLTKAEYLKVVPKPDTLQMEIFKVLEGEAEI